MCEVSFGMVRTILGSSFWFSDVKTSMLNGSGRVFDVFFVFVQTAVPEELFIRIWILPPISCHANMLIISLTLFLTSSAQHTQCRGVAFYVQSVWFRIDFCLVCFRLSGRAPTNYKRWDQSAFHKVFSRVMRVVSWHEALMNTNLTLQLRNRKHWQVFPVPFCLPPNWGDLEGCGKVRPP